VSDAIKNKTYSNHRKIFHNYYSEKNSSTYTRLAQNESSFIKFGTGSLTGDFVYDDIRIGLTNKDSADGPNSIHLKNYKFGLITKEEGIFNNFAFDAIVGMSYIKLAHGNTVPMVDAIIQ